MTVSDFQSLMLSLQKLAGDKRGHFMSEVCDVSASEFRLSGSDRKELPLIGRQAKFDSSLAWLGIYLRKADLLKITGCGWLRIISRDFNFLKSEPSQVDINLLMQYLDIQKFKDILDKNRNEMKSEE